MASFNQVILIGRLGKDPELRFSQNGMPISTFSIAVEEFGGGKSTTQWFNIVAFEKLAETCEKYLVKGQEIQVVGRIKLEEYTDKEGHKRQSTKIHISQMQMLAKPKAQESNFARTSKAEGDYQEDYGDELP